MAATSPDQDEMVQAALSDGREPDDIYIIDCPYCKHCSYYSQGFTSQCTNCGMEIAQYSDEAYTLGDYFSRDDPSMTHYERPKTSRAIGW